MAPDPSSSSVVRWWLRHPKSGNVVLVVHEETRDRCLSEGWTPTTDPRLTPPASAPEPVSAPAPAAPVDVAPSVPVPAPAPASPTDLTDLTAIGDTPEALAGALEAAEAAGAQVQTAIRERNTAARTAFGLQTPPHNNPAPAPAVRKRGSGR